VYGEIQELIPQDASNPLGKMVTLTHYVDANLMHDTSNGRSVTRIMQMINKTPLDWYSKKQATVETATYGSEFVAARVCVEQIIDLQNTLRSLGVPIRSRSYMFGDNKSVVDSSMQVYAKLHKRHNMLSFHRVCEAIASGMIGSILSLATLIWKMSSENIGGILKYGINLKHFCFGRATLVIYIIKKKKAKSKVHQTNGEC
jgi:hypothetical protein